MLANEGVGAIVTTKAKTSMRQRKIEISFIGLTLLNI
jgi:hypothetical protein